jgi:hypothetical protein
MISLSLNSISVRRSPDNHFDMKNGLTPFAFTVKSWDWIGEICIPFEMCLHNACFYSLTLSIPIKSRQ